MLTSLSKSRFTTIIVTIIMLLAPGGLVLAIDYDEEINRKERERQKAEQALIDSTNRQYAYLQEGLSLAEQVAAMEEDFEAVERDAEASIKRLADIEEEISQMQSEFETKRDNSKVMSQSLYKYSRVNVLHVILSSDGMSDLVTRMGLHIVGMDNMVSRLDEMNADLGLAASRYNDLTDEIASLDRMLELLKKEKEDLEQQKALFEQLAAQESARQAGLATHIANITAEQQKLLEEKMRATDQGTSVGEYGDVKVDLPNPPFSPAYAVASLGRPHKVGMSQSGAYGRSIAGQDYEQILKAYFKDVTIQSYPVSEQIKVSNYCVKYGSGGCEQYATGMMSFEDQYLLGIAEMPTYWANSGGYEALKAQAVLARSYAIAFTDNGNPSKPICADQRCQVYYHPKVTDPAAKRWHDAVNDTRGIVIKHGGSVIRGYYSASAGGYTRLPTDFDVGWGGTLPYLMRIRDADSQGRAYEGPAYADFSWYYRVWYAPSDVHPWLTEAEMVDLLNSSMLSSGYNKYLSHPNLGGWTHQRVRDELVSQGKTPIAGITSLQIINDNTGYVRTVVVNGNVNVDGIRFWEVYRLRTRGHLALWSALYDIIERK